jgi:hypothetical protein
MFSVTLISFFVKVLINSLNDFPSGVLPRSILPEAMSFVRAAFAGLEIQQSGGQEKTARFAEAVGLPGEPCST